MFSKFLRFYAFIVIFWSGVFIKQNYLKVIKTIKIIFNQMRVSFDFTKHKAFPCLICYVYVIFLSHIFNVECNFRNWNSKLKSLKWSQMTQSSRGAKTGKKTPVKNVNKPRLFKNKAFSNVYLMIIFFFKIPLKSFMCL